MVEWASELLGQDKDGAMKQPHQWLGWIAAGVLLAGCQSAEPPLGAQVEFVQEIMRESGRQGDGAARSEAAVQAVRDWRGSADE